MTPHATAHHVDPPRRCGASPGNQALQRHLRPVLSLPIAPADDALEREADRTADTILQGSIVRTPRHRHRAQPAPPPGLLDGAGHPLDAATRTWFESRFARDFSDVRIHTGAAADSAARSVGAHAFTIGDTIAFANSAYDPNTARGRRLLAHELSHVAQNQATRDAGPHGAGPSVSPAAPALRRAINVSGRVPMGMLTITGDAQPQNRGHLGSHEEVQISFQPDAYPASPATNRIDFIQIASSPGSALGIPSVDPKERIKDTTRTTVGAGSHLTVAGDTAQSVSTAHFGDPSHASAILQANTGQLVWWLAQQPGGDNTTRPLPAGVALTIPDAVKGGYVVDIDPVEDPTGPKLKQPRTAKSDPNIAPEYPHMKTELLPAGYFGPVYGFNHADGTQHAATMVDIPGGGPFAGEFRFESYAHAEDLGITYGGVKWGFQYGYNGIAGEWATIVPGVSDTAKAAVVAFNRVYRNDHVAQAGDTLNALSMLYYGDAAHASMIYQLNRTVLSTPDPNAPIPPGTHVDVGTGPTAWDRARAPANP